MDVTNVTPFNLSRFWCIRNSDSLLNDELGAVRLLQVIDGSGVPYAAHVRNAVSPLSTVVTNSGCSTISAVKGGKYQFQIIYDAVGTIK